MVAVKYAHPVAGGLESTLRAEVASAIHGMLFQLHHGDFVDHHTLPVSDASRLKKHVCKLKIKG